MRKYVLLAIIFLTTSTAFTQDFSNKGKDFWITSGWHYAMGTGTPPVMTLSLTSDVNTTYSIEAYGVGVISSGNITANSVTNVNIPNAYFTYTPPSGGGNGLFNGKAIHVTAVKPIVVYSFTTQALSSAATLCLPTNVLGKQYYAASYTQVSANATGNNFITIIAVEDNTSIEIIPTAMTAGGWAANSVNTINLNKGQIYQVLGAMTGNSGSDLTGSSIRSIASGLGGCKRIAVFSGSGRVWIPSSCGNGADNLYQQLYPISTWGRKYLTVPSSGRLTNYYRIINPKPVPTSNVRVNGAVIPSTSFVNNFYEFSNNTPNLIEADSAICVAQYFTSAACVGNPNPYDPDMVILNPVEQNISDVTLNSSDRLAHTITPQHFIHIIMKNAGTAISSFKFDGAPIPPTANWVTHPMDPSYSYLYLNIVSETSHSLRSDSGFNALAYGYATNETYAYSAGTNVKDLYQQIGVQTQYGIESTPSVCTNSPFKFKVSLPYIPDSMHWNFNGAPGMLPNNNTVYVDNTGNIAEDSFTVVNGKTIHWYSVPLQYTFSTIGTYPVTISTFVPNGECGSVQDIDFDLGVSDPPIADFNPVLAGCVADSFHFTETTPQFPKTTYKIWWDFGDPGSGAANNTSSLRNPAHLFSAPGNYTVRYAAITTPGCLSDTISKPITVTPIPSATIARSTPAVCLNTLPEPIITFTGTDGTAEYTFTYNINGGPTLTTLPSVGGISTVTVPTNVAGPLRYNLLGVRNQNPAVTSCTRSYNNVFVDVMINPLPVAAISGGTTVCLNNPPTTPVTFTGSGGTAPYTFNYNLNGIPQTPVVSNAAGIYVINAPTNVAGPFNYAITLVTDASSTLCSAPSNVSTIINVDDDARITLTSAAGTDNQTKCINTNITDIDYLVDRGGTGATIAWNPSPGVPPGISFTSLGGGNFRISGIPTVASPAGNPYKYTVTTTGPCIKPSLSGTLAVTPDATVTLRPGDNNNQTVCIDSAITQIRYDIGGSGTGASVTFTPALPGVSGNYSAGVLTITGNPTLAGTFTYTIDPTGPCAFPIPALSGTINVTGNATLSLVTPGRDVQKLCKNSAILQIEYDFGGTATGATVTGLPPGVTWSVTGNRVTIVGTPTVSLPAAYIYTVSTLGPCVKPSLTGTILVDELPTPAFSFTIPTCDTRTISFTDNSVPNTGTIVSWAWDFGDPASPNNTDNIATPTHVFTAANTTPGYNVTLIVTTSEGCSNAIPFPRTVTVNHRPVAGFIVPDVCINDVATIFTDTSKVTGGTIDRINNHWNYGDGLPNAPSNNSIGQDGSHLYPTPNTYYVTQIVTSNITGCKDTVTIPIIINSADPVSNFTAANSCSSDSVDLVNLSTVGYGNVTKLEIYWNNTGTPQTILAPVFNGIYRHKYPTLPTTQTYTIRMIAYSGVICFSTLIKTVTVYATPIVQFNAIPDLCLLRTPYQITQGSEIGGLPPASGIGTYSGPGITNPNGTFDPTVAGIGIHNIKYTWTVTATGCFDTLTRIIKVLDTAHAKFSVVTPICEQVPASFTDLSTAPASVTMDHTIWNFGDGSPSENHSPPGVTFTHPFVLPGTFLVTMHSVSAYGCLSTDTSMFVTVGANHSIGLAAGSGSPTQTVCVNKLIVPITYNLGGGANNVSIPSLPAGLGYVVNGAGTSVTISGAPTATVGSPFNFTVQTSGNTCTAASANISITVNPDHTIAFNSGDTMQSVCVNTPIDNIVYNLGGGATGISILPGGNLPPGVNATVSGNTVTITGTPTATGTFNYNIETSGNACVKANVIGQIVVHAYPVPSFTVDKTAYCIPNAIVKFTNTTANLLNNTYKWDFGDGSPTEPFLHPMHWYTSGTGPFTVTLTATSIAVPILNGGLPGCVTALPVPMTSIHPQPKAGFVFSKPGVCIGAPVTITDATDGRDGIVNEWHWDLGDGTKELINPVTHTYADTITYVITMYTVNSFGCNSDTINVLPLTGPPINPFTVYPYPHVNAGNDKSVLEGGSVVLDATAFANNPRYTWTPNLYLTDASALTPRVMNPKTDMTYRLTVRGNGGCEISDDVFVKLLRFPVIPNTFTPNNDGRNDKWVISFLNTYPDNRVQIFTRSGKLVFESRGYNTPWDGTLKGKPLPFDTYYYIIEPGNGRDPLTGYVTILK